MVLLMAILFPVILGLTAVGLIVGLVVGLQDSIWLTTTTTTTTPSTTTTTTTTTTQEACPSAGLVHWWNFDNELVDVIGGVELNCNDDVEFGIDRNSQENMALSFDQGYCTAPSGVYFKESFSLASWYKISSDVPDDEFITLIVFSNFEENVIGLGISEDGRENLIAGIELLEESFGNSFSYDEWIHIAITLDATTGYSAYYINGNMTDSNYLKDHKASAVTREDNYIGAYIDGGDTFFIGSMDEIKIYDIALTPEQVYNLANKC